MSERMTVQPTPATSAAHGHKRPAIFFDVDGVLNEEPGQQGVLKPEDVVLLPQAGKAVAAARRAGFHAVAVTNRAQVARGHITFDDLDRILGRLETLLAGHGALLDRIYVCPHHPEHGFPDEIAALKIACECRKPGALLFRRAMAELPIEPTRSVAIGDGLRDMGAARAAGVWAYGVRTGYGCRDFARYPGGAAAAPTPDLMFDDVGEAVRFAAIYRKLAAPIVQSIPGGRKLIVIAICGRSRSGKSIIAHALVRSLRETGGNCLHVRLDDWIIPAAQRGPNDSAEIRNRVDRLPAIVSALRQGKPVIAPGYDAANRIRGMPITYDPSGCSIVVLEGVFAAHPSVRGMIDLAAFVDAPEAVQRARFASLYRWKGLDDAAIERLWRVRMGDEWAVVDAQRASCNVIVTASEP
jgi:mannose-1-phosphate guanylyltransferase/phosphomannomutase